MTIRNLALPQVLVWRVRFEAADGRMTTCYVPVTADEKAEVLEIPSLRIHCPNWIGQNFVTLTGKLFLAQRMKLSCKLCTEMEVDPFDFAQVTKDEKEEPAKGSESGCQD